MFSLLRNSSWISPILLTAGVMTATPAFATPMVGNNQQVQLQTGRNLIAEVPPTAPASDRSNESPNSSIEQVTSVSQLSDVQPTDWAFQALQSLVERYGCIAGYPNSTFRGNRAMTRYEFAAGLNACWNRVNELIATSTADLVTKEDLQTLQKLQEEFAEGLTELRGRVDGLEGRTAILERQQFSTTTKLSGDVILTFGGVFGEDRALNSDQWNEINARTTPEAREAARATAYGASGSRLQDNTIFADRVRLILDSSFTGKDRLRLILRANNTIAFNAPVTGTNMTRLGWDTTLTPDNAVGIRKLFYNFPVGEKLNITVDAVGGSFFDNFNTVNPLFSAATTGAMSRFGRFAPIY